MEELKKIIDFLEKKLKEFNELNIEKNNDENEMLSDALNLIVDMYRRFIEISAEIFYDNNIDKKSKMIAQSFVLEKLGENYIDTLSFLKRNNIKYDYSKKVKDYLDFLKESDVFHDLPPY